MSKIVIDVEENFHKAVRIKAIEEGLTMKDFIVKTVLDAIGNNSSKIKLCINKYMKKILIIAILLFMSTNSFAVEKTLSDYGFTVNDKTPVVALIKYCTTVPAGNATDPTLVPF
jgi:hypothetical protein